MALGVQEDPVAGFRFGVEIQGLVVGWFTECGGLTVERTVVPWEEGGVNDYVHQLPGPLKRTQITLKRGIADGALWDWFRQGAYDGQVVRRNVSVILYGVDRAETRRWDLTDVYPTNWTGAEFRTGEGQVAVETLELGQGSSESESSSGWSGSAVQRALSDVQEGAGAPGGLGRGQAMDREVDLPALAQRVYDLLRQELRRERERLGRYR